MDELIDVAISALQIAVLLVLNVGLLIVGLQMIYKAIDIALIAVGFGSIRRDTEDDIHERNQYEANRKVYNYTDEEEKSYREYLKRNNY